MSKVFQARSTYFAAFFAVLSLAFIYGSRGSANTPPVAPVGTSAIPQEVSEIRVQRRDDLKTEEDMKRLSQLQGRYRERVATTSQSSAVRRASVKKSAKLKVRKRN